MSKIGQGAFEAWLRAGHKEVTQILPAFPDSIRPVEEPGLPGNLTPQEVAMQKDVYQQDLAPTRISQTAREPMVPEAVEPELER